MVREETQGRCVDTYYDTAVDKQLACRWAAKVCVEARFGTQEGKQACHWAAFFGTAQLLQDLVEQHPNLEAKDRRGNTALHLAAATNHL